MQYLVTKAVAQPITDLGEFQALASTYGVDRQGERIAPGAFADTIAAWAGRPMPLHWNHEGGADKVIGSITSMQEMADGLLVEGQLDIEDSAVAREAWRSVKAGRIGLSIGYMVQRSHPDGEVKVLDQVDLFEISITPSPANPGARILGWKSLDPRPLKVEVFEC
jgi:uncharacterized protein